MFKLVNNRFFIISLVILVIGVIFRLALTENGNFLFGIDSARDFVDVREMVELKKLRLTGPNTAIDGLYNGPIWYYLLAIGYILSNGDPYSAILMQIGLWFIGGFFLLKLVKSFGSVLVIVIGSLWIASNYIVLANLYSFNPTPVLLLTPVFIYSLVEYLKTGRVIYGISAWVLAGLFFNLEMNFGIFMPIVIFTSVVLTQRLNLLKDRWFWFGVLLFISTLFPQLIFDLKHQFIMSKAVLRHLSENTGRNINLLARFQDISLSFYNTFLPTLMNQKLLTWIILGFFIPAICVWLKKKEKELIVSVSNILIVVPFIGYLVLPVAINPWHLGGEMVASVLLIAYLIKELLAGRLLSKITAILLSTAIIVFSLINIGNFFLNDRGKSNQDPSLYKNEIAAIDYIYQKANGKNFKVYTYLPSIMDYPYQYLIWWYGFKRFGYLPEEYAYASNKPQYIPSKASFSATEAVLKLRENSNLVFLIKEPNRNYTRFGWEGDFIKYNWETIEKQMVGPIEVEVRKE